MSRYFLALLTFIWVVPTIAATYKWVDEKGVTHYSETPPPGRKAQEVQGQPTPPSGTQGAEPASDALQEQEREFQKRRIRREQADEAKRKQEADEKLLAALKKKKCARAQRNLQVLKIERPVYSINEEGKRVFVDDSARPAAIEAAKKGIEMYCEPQ